MEGSTFQIGAGRGQHHYAGKDTRPLYLIILLARFPGCPWSGSEINLG